MTFDRFAICAAYQALENDWNRGGILWERPSNQRRSEATSVQLMRMGYRSPYHGGTFTALDDDEKDIYINALVKFGMAPLVRPDDDIGDFINAYYVPEFISENFPQIK